MQQFWENILHLNFTPISLDEMKSVTLLNRRDTKYVFHHKKLKDVLMELAAHYKVLKIDNEVLYHYNNTYYDTQDYNFFNQHHRGKLNRVKVRTRSYSSLANNFFEVKIKTNKNRTDKYRCAYEESDQNAINKWNELLKEHTHFEIVDLPKQLNINYKRVSLINTTLNERCTIDFHIECNAENKTHSFTGLCIIELKQDVYSMHSPMASILKKHRIYPGNFSKYCFSLLALNPDLKHHLFKPKINQLNKLLYA